MSTQKRSSLQERMARHADTAPIPASTSVRADEKLDQRLTAVHEFLAALEESKTTAPERLAEARSHAADERIKSQMEEPWADFITGIPTVTRDGEPTGKTPMPTMVAKDVFGTRLAFDLLGCCADEDQVAEKLREYFKMTGDPGHMFLVCAAALETIANHVMPALLDTLEHQASDYDTRVRLADAARNAWTTRVADLGEVRPAQEVTE